MSRFDRALLRSTFLAEQMSAARERAARRHVRIMAEHERHRRRLNAIPHNDQEGPR